MPKSNLREAQQRHARHYAAILTSANKQYLQGGESTIRGLNLFDLEWANVRFGQNWAAADAPSDNEAAYLCSEYPDVGLYCLNIRLHPQTWIQ